MSGSAEAPDPARGAVGIAVVLERMSAIARSLPAEDGVARFNGRYLEVTREVLAETRSDAFEDARFLERLDVMFAELYLAAIDAAQAGKQRRSPRHGCRCSGPEATSGLPRFSSRWPA
jgi:hypothetical protein